LNFAGAAASLAGNSYEYVPRILPNYSRRPALATIQPDAHPEHEFSWAASGRWVDEAVAWRRGKSCLTSDFSRA
jgi:hypothetical protein